MSKAAKANCSRKSQASKFVGEGALRKRSSWNQGVLTFTPHAIDTIALEDSLAFVEYFLRVADIAGAICGEDGNVAGSHAADHF